MASDGVQGYLEFLATRDGEPDLLRHTLSRREDFFAALAREPVRSRLCVERTAYLRNLDRRRPEPGLDDRMLWILATAKANQAERFGVGLAELYGRIRDDGDPVRVHVLLQETYHTRILADVVGVFGLPVHARPPALVTRLFTEAIVFTPDGWNLPLAGAAEMAGCIMFRALRDCGIRLFADEPAVAERIRLLYDEILADEVSHVGFVAVQLGERGRAVMRGLYRLLGRRLAVQMPEMVALFGHAELARRFGAPFRAPEMAAEFPRLAFVAATP